MQSKNIFPFFFSFLLGTTCQRLATTNVTLNLFGGFFVPLNPCLGAAICASVCCFAPLPATFVSASPQPNFLLCPNGTRSTKSCGNIKCPAGQSCIQGFCCPTSITAGTCPNHRHPVSGCDSNSRCGLPGYHCVENFCCAS